MDVKCSQQMIQRIYGENQRIYGLFGFLCQPYVNVQAYNFVLRNFYICITVILCNSRATGITQQNCKNSIWIQTAFSNTPLIFYWLVKQVVLPQSHSIGRVNVALSSWLWCSNISRFWKEHRVTVFPFSVKSLNGSFIVDAAYCCKLENELKSEEPCF